MKPAPPVTKTVRIAHTVPQRPARLLHRSFAGLRFRNRVLIRRRVLELLAANALIPHHAVDNQSDGTVASNVARRAKRVDRDIRRDHDRNLGI